MSEKMQSSDTEFGIPNGHAGERTKYEGKKYTWQELKKKVAEEKEYNDKRQRIIKDIKSFIGEISQIEGLEKLTRPDQITRIESFLKAKETSRVHNLLKLSDKENLETLAIILLKYRTVKGFIREVTGHENIEFDELLKNNIGSIPVPVIDNRSDFEKNEDEIKEKHQAKVDANRKTRDALKSKQDAEDFRN